MHQLQEDIDDDLEVEAVRIAVAEQMKGYDEVSYSIFLSKTKKKRDESCVI